MDDERCTRMDDGRKTMDEDGRWTVDGRVMLQKCCGSVELKAGALIIALMSVTKQLLACGAVGMIIYLVVTGRYISRVNLEDWSINVEMNDVG
ncbi:hypothetical protein MSG28_003814 [Choristoneura fumiferana]|uniref:Uncharacterized protein n=1 Tax=Choristoneura fumiferana TaxID=7141 RepID=A0ACC0KG86_CHOFU|nr:hypothetical protein MSG28_003814 [Choristoneura fumiferana]